MMQARYHQQQSSANKSGTGSMPLSSKRTQQTEASVPPMSEVWPLSLYLSLSLSLSVPMSLTLTLSLVFLLFCVSSMLVPVDVVLQSVPDQYLEVDQTMRSDRIDSFTAPGGVDEEQGYTQDNEQAEDTSAPLDSSETSKSLDRSLITPINSSPRPSITL